MPGLHRRYRFVQVLFSVVTSALLTLLIALPLLADRAKSGEEEKTVMQSDRSTPTLELPEPVRNGDLSLEQAIERRRSVRTFSGRALTREEISQLLWAAQGVTSGRDLRAAPSAGATYPLELYLVNGSSDGLPTGLYKYISATHRLVSLNREDLRAALSRAALSQRAIVRAPAALVICAVYERTTERYGDRGIRYVHMEAGHAAQNLYLQAEALRLGGVVIGAFRDREVARVLQLPDDEVPLYLMPIGHPE